MRLLTTDINCEVLQSPMLLYKSPLRLLRFPSCFSSLLIYWLGAWTTKYQNKNCTPTFLSPSERGREFQKEDRVCLREIERLITSKLENRNILSHALWKIKNRRMQYNWAQKHKFLLSTTRYRVAITGRRLLVLAVWVLPLQNESLEDRSECTATS